MATYGEFTGEFSLFIGRWQPLHQSHIKLMRVVLDEGGKVCIGIRNSKVDENNPYSVEDRVKMIKKEFHKELSNGTVEWAVLPDIKECCHGRRVGWGVREIKLDKESEDVSGTKIREQDDKIR